MNHLHSCHHFLLVHHQFLLLLYDLSFYVCLVELKFKSP
jgi:hypothetical protein